ncbi:MAG TPA: sugar phosphate isomerase/epimerase [Chryseolinea sp.]|nr:sugar phosphate isomerase/epimerase [Chryseolinea sp.]
MKRREFVQTASFAAVGLLSLPSFLAAGKAQKGMGLQLYALRSIIGKDPKGVLQKVASYGYKELETFSYNDGKIFGLDFTEFCTYAKSLGMKVTSGHYGLTMIKGDAWKKAVDDAKKNGQEFMVMPYINEPDRKSIDDYKKICADLNAAGEVCNKSGIRFQYHNHAFEFENINGEVPFDVMLKELDHKKVGMELDIYWIVNGGQDPVKYFKQYPGYFEQWHIKDMDKTDRTKNANVGDGSIDFKTLFTHAKAAGMKRWYVEYDTFPGDPLECVAASAKNLKTIL